MIYRYYVEPLRIHLRNWYLTINHAQEVFRGLPLEDSVPALSAWAIRAVATQNCDRLWENPPYGIFCENQV